MQRFGAVFPGMPFPKSLSDMPLTALLQWKSIDAEAVAIAEGNISADQQAWLMTNTLDVAVPAQPDPEEAKQAYMAEQEAKWAAQLQAQREQQERNKVVAEANREASLEKMHAQFRAQGYAARGW